MFDHPAPSITTIDGETGTDFVPAPAGLNAAIVLKSNPTCVRKELGPVVGYARFGAGSEPFYTTAAGLHRLTTTSLIGWWDHKNFPVTTDILTFNS